MFGNIQTALQFIGVKTNHRTRIPSHILCNQHQLHRRQAGITDGVFTLKHTATGLVEVKNTLGLLFIFKRIEHTQMQ